MVRRILDATLVLIILVGGVFAWRSGEQRARSQSEFNRLSRQTGDLAISDPSRVHVRALPTNDPMHFAWRVYLPPSYSLQLRSSLGGTSGSFSATSKDFIARARIREDENGDLQIYTRFSGSSTKSMLGDRALAQRLHGRWNIIVVEQLGASDLVALEPDRPAILLRLTVPEELQPGEQTAKFPKTQNHDSAVLWQWEIGPTTTKR